MAKQFATAMQIRSIALYSHIYSYVDYHFLTYFRTAMFPGRAEQALLSHVANEHIHVLINHLKNPSDVDVVDDHQNTPLLLAAKQGKLLSVIALSDAGADIDHANQHGLTALMLAVINNHYSIFYYLLMRGSNILLYSLSGSTVLQWAIAYARIDMLNLLITQRSINLNNRYQEGYTPLMNAIIANKIGVVKWLLAHGSHLDEFNDDGESALALAKKMKRNAIYNYLKQKANSGMKIYSRRTRTSQYLISLRLSMGEAYDQGEEIFKLSTIKDEQIENEQPILHEEKKKTKTHKDFTRKTRSLTSKKKSRLRRRRTQKHINSASPLKTNPTLLSSEIDIPKSGNTVIGKEELEEHGPTSPELIAELATVEDMDVDVIKKSIPEKAPIPIRTLKAVLPHHVKTIMAQLEQLGFKIYLVGGCIRDMLLDKKPSDFDMICNASTLVVAKNLRLGVLSKHIPNLYKIFLPDVSIDLICVENLDLTVDAKKRDFTCNALYMNWQCQLFDPLDKKGIDDVLQRKIVVIGEATLRFQEDPIRLLRLVRLVAQHHFTITGELQETVRQSAYLLQNCEPGRLKFQIRKLFLQGAAVNNYRTLNRLTLLPFIFSEIPSSFFQEAKFNEWIISRLEKTDEMVQLSQPVSLYYVLAMFKVAPSIMQDTYDSKKPPISSVAQSQLYQFFNKTEHLTCQIITEAKEAKRVSLRA